MSRKRLAPIKDKLHYHTPVKDELLWFWWSNIYLPLLEIIKKHSGVAVKTKYNVRKAALLRALEDSVVTYQDGFFVGQFNAEISKDCRSLGAEWNKTKKAFKIALVLLPQDIHNAIRSGEEKLRKLSEEIKAKLKEIDTVQLKAKLNFVDYAQGIVQDLQKQLRKTLASAITVPMEFTPEIEKRLAEGYSAELNSYTDDFSKETIDRLHEVVRENVSEGFRADKLAKVLRSDFDVKSKQKAKFLAKQETSILVSNYREARYTELGLDKYMWSTSKDSAVRPDHKDLDGRVFEWDKPPITDKATGSRNNPGKDWGCRMRIHPCNRRNKMMYGYIYKTKNKKNKKVYIGQHKGKFDAAYLGSGLLIKRSINKFGKKQFKLEVVVFAKSKEELNVLEKKFIAEYRKRLGRRLVYNIADGGYDSISLSMRRKISKTLTGKLVGELNPFFGHKHSRSVRRIISLKTRGRYGALNPNYKGGVCSKKSFCKDCNKEICRGSVRCKSCVGKIRDSKHFVRMAKKRGAPWNVGLTKETDPRMAIAAKNRCGIPAWNKVAIPIIGGV